MKRVCFDIVLFISIFIFPWWISALLMVVGISIFTNFYEFIITGSIIYSLYSIPSERIISNPLFYVTVVSVVYFGIQYLKDNIITYKK